MQTGQELTFDRYRLDLTHSQLWRGKRAMVLTRQTFAVLQYLVEHAGQAVTKGELFEALWPGTVVSDGALIYCIVELRKALGDNAKQPKFIETIHRRGYRFLPTVTSHPVVSIQYPGVRSKAEARGWRRETRSPSAQTPSLQPQGPNIVGRETELAQLHAYLEKALSGKRQMVFVTGEPGIGKTTLLDAFRQRLEDRGLRVAPFPPASSPKSLVSAVNFAHGQCIEHYGLGEPYMPILEALGRLCRAPERKRLISLLSHHAPTWVVQLPTLLTASELEALQRSTQGASRERMLREMGEALDAITVERPLVLVLEDLHWSDVSTLELLSLLARRREPARLLVIGTYRPIDVIAQEHPLRVVKQELQLHGLCTELPLGLLSETQVAEYLETRFGPRFLLPSSFDSAQDRSFPPGQGEHRCAARLQQFARTIHHRTDGNPLFMVTTVNDLVSQGVLGSSNNQGILPDDLRTVAMKVPDTVQQLIDRHLERLSAVDRGVLEVASIAGMDFSAAAVAAGAGMATEGVEELCEELARRGHFLRAQGTGEWPDGTVAGQYSFLHALYQEVLYNRIPVGRRQRLHQCIGMRKEEAYGERAGEIAAELAVHFEQGRDYQKAVHYLQQAAQTAMRRSANQEAVNLLSESLEFLKLWPDTRKRDEQELTLQIALGSALLPTKG